MPGVVVVSNSWGSPEFLGEAGLDSYFTTFSGHGGVSFVVAAGDSGGPAGYPSASPNVLSVGGTSLNLTSLNNWSSETVWNEAGGATGGGASLYENPPNYQKGLGLLSRGTPDVSYYADGTPGVAVFSTFAFGGWAGVAGTSSSAPQWAGIIAIADQGRALVGKNTLSNVQSVMYGLPASDFHDVTVGNNGLTPGTANLAGMGYDLASGRGTPIANLVIRDLVAFNGPIVAPLTPPPGSVNTGQFWFFVKPFVTAASGEGGSAASGAPAAAVDVTPGAGDGSGSSTSTADASQTPVDASVADVSALRPTLRSIDSLWANGDNSDDEGRLSHRSRFVHQADDEAADAALQLFFDRLDGAAIALN